MNRNRKAIWILWVTVVALIGFPVVSLAAFYKYTDKDGNTVFVDDKSNIPEEYLDDVDIYKEKYDHLPADEKRRREEIDHRINQEKETADRIWLDEKLRIERDRDTEEKRIGSLQTKVNIRNNKVLVTVILGYAGKEKAVPLILDTGASLVVLHRGVADQLNLKSLKSGASQTAGGGIIRSDLARLSYLKVGQITMNDPKVLIIDYEGPPVEYKGLLGMNFLKNFEYRIDFSNQVIDWKYQPK